MNWKKKTAIALLFTMFMGGGSIAYMRRIRGWDYPWDPSTYDLPDVIDWADTANPSYFLRDLGSSGGNVYDLTRHLKYILTNANFETELKIWIEKIALYKINMKHLPTSINDTIKQGIGVFGMTNAKDVLKEPVKAPDDQKVFRTSKTQSRDNDDSDLEKDKLKQREKVVSDTLDSTKASLKDTDARLKMVSDILENSSNAEGIMQSIEADTQMSAIIAEENKRKIGLMNNFINVKATRSMAKQDKEYQDIHEGKTFLPMSVADPEKPEETLGAVAQEYERPKPKGLVRFSADE